MAKKQISICNPKTCACSVISCKKKLTAATLRPTVPDVYRDGFTNAAYKVGNAAADDLSNVGLPDEDRLSGRADAGLNSDGRYGRGFDVLGFHYAPLPFTSSSQTIENEFGDVAQSVFGLGLLPLTAAYNAGLGAVSLYQRGKRLVVGQKPSSLNNKIFSKKNFVVSRACSLLDPLRTPAQMYR